MTLINKILTGVVILIITGAFIGGCQYGKSKVKCPTISHDTTTIYDTVVHNIVDSFPYYVNHHDTIIYDHNIPTIVDTAKILKDYFATHIFDRKWEDDTLKVNVIDSISKNIPIGNSFKYKIKVPFSTVINTTDNSITYESYLNIGLGVPIQDASYTDFYLIYNFSKGGFGIGYTPKLKSFEIKGEMNIFKFKHKK
jgi:hypothetical protein